MWEIVWSVEAEVIRWKADLSIGDSVVLYLTEIKKVTNF